MTPENVLAIAPKILSQEQRRFYFDKGYLLLENAISREWVQRLLDTTNQMIEQSRILEQSDAVFDLEPEHTSDTPRLRRLSTPSTNTPNTGLTPPSRYSPISPPTWLARMSNSIIRNSISNGPQAAKRSSGTKILLIGRILIIAH